MYTHLVLSRAGTLKIDHFIPSFEDGERMHLERKQSIHSPQFNQREGTAFGKDADLLRDLLLLIHIDTTELDCAVRVRAQEIFEDKGDGFAWSTPRSPEVND